MSVRKNAMFITKCVGTQCQSYSVEKFVYNFLIAKTFNPLSANPKKWSNTLKQFVGNLATNCLSGFDHFVKLALKGLIARKSTD